MDDLNLDFGIVKERFHSNQLSFYEISFFRRSFKMTRERHMVRSKENIGNVVFSRMAPSAMTSGDPESQTGFRFVLLLRVRFAQKVCDWFSPYFLQLVGLPALIIIVAKLGCYSSRDVGTGTNFCYFRTFSVPYGRCFVMLSLHSFDLLYSSGLVVRLVSDCEIVADLIGFRCTGYRAVVLGPRPSLCCVP